MKHKNPFNNLSKFTIELFFISMSLTVTAQKSWTDVYIIKNNFKIGAVQVYDVNELYKVDNLLFGIKYNVKSNVFIQVVDSAEGGYWMKYNVIIKNNDNKKDSIVYIMGMIMAKISLSMYAKNGIFFVDSASYHRNKNDIIKLCDSLYQTTNMGASNKTYLKDLLFKLKNLNGISLFLSPLMMLQQFFSNNNYKKFHLTSNAIEKYTQPNNVHRCY